MKKGLIYLGMFVGLASVGSGCASDDKTAQKPQGSYIHARHMQVGSNIPQPNRGVDGNDDTAQADLEREQYMHQSQMGHVGTSSGLGGGGVGGR